MKKGLDLYAASTSIMGDRRSRMMEYTVKKLAALAKVSPRTLRYYDEIGLLKPRVSTAQATGSTGSMRSTAFSRFYFTVRWGLSWQKSYRFWTPRALTAWPL